MEIRKATVSFTPTLSSRFYMIKFCLIQNINPDCVHLTLTPAHTTTRAQFIIDLKASIKIVEENPSLEKKGTAGIWFIFLQKNSMVG